MRTFLLAHWRLVHWRFVVFTLMGALLPPYLAALGWRESLPAGVRDLMNSVVRAKRPGEWRTNHDEVARLLGELDERSRSLGFRSEWLRPPLDLALYFGPLRELSWVATDEDLNAEIMRGVSFAALAAGLRASPANYDSCSRLAELAVNSSGLASADGASECRMRLLCSAWAMLRMDAPRAATWIMDTLSGRSFDDIDQLLALLGYSGRPEVEPQLQSLRPAIRMRGSWTDDALDRCITNLHSNRTPEEYWLGW